MLKSLAAIFGSAAALGLSLAACASSAGGDPVSGSEDLTSVTTCGGIAGLTCPAGQDCVIAKKDVNTPDASGRCRKPVGRGGDNQACGGFAGIPCGPGLDCVIGKGPNGETIPDLGGTCQEPKQPVDNQTCGGFAGIACPDGFDCVLPTKKGQHAADMAGHCEKSKDDSDGQACGGLAGLRCPPKMTCVLGDGPNGHPIPDAPGKCQK